MTVASGSGPVSDLRQGSEARVLLWVAAAAIAVRLAYLTEHLASSFFGVPILDEAFYDAVARALVAGGDLGGLDAGFRPLLYPFLLAAANVALTSFEREVRGPFFAGERLGIVDVAAAPALFRFVVAEERSSLRVLRGYPKVDAWAKRLAQRPSVSGGVPEGFADRYLDSLEGRDTFFAREFITKT